MLDASSENLVKFLKVRNTLDQSIGDTNHSLMQKTRTPSLQTSRAKQNTVPAPRYGN
jgi:hypothetical protein